MKKLFKIAGIALLSLIGLLLAIFLLARFVFREQAIDYLTGLEKQQRVELLRAAGPYAADTVQYRFTYKQDTARAREIREYFRLDTLVNPAATTWDNARALAQFVARNIPHANQKVQPETRNAIGLWEYTRTVEPAFNCRLHSILLHELLLSQGIVNRFVTCLPADSLDRDCHVVNLVWLPECEKWAMIDSDMQSYLARRRSALTRRDAAAHRRRRADGRTPASRNTRPGELPLLLGQEPLLVHLLGADRIRQGGRIRRPRHRPAAPGVRGILAG